jgi:hypothetical protein
MVSADNIELYNKFEVHYIFQDSSHSMDAFVRNDSEKELLGLFREMSILLGISVKIETEPRKEGGLRDIFKIISRNERHITLTISILTLIMSRIPVENKDLVDLQIENLRLDNELKTRELNSNHSRQPIKVNIESEGIEQLLEHLVEDYRILWHRSNFYKRINSYHKIDSVSFQNLNNENQPISNETIIHRHQFTNYILRSDAFPPNIDEDAYIDIISPVLKKGRFNWKGFYNGEIISFEMADKTFQDSVLNKKVEFITGTIIKCVLHQTRKIDEIGAVKVVHSKVITVFDVITGDNIHVIEDKSKYDRRAQVASNQLKLDF